MNRFPDAVIMVFCKAPVPGRVKTRLIPPLTAEEAAALHCELTERTLRTVTDYRLCDVQLWCSPSIEHPHFEQLKERFSIALQAQQGADLGERMQSAFAQALANYRHAILIGCDCPSLNHADLEQALIKLDEKTCCVITPAEDGGYVLLGLNQVQPRLFADMPWGTDRVMTLTRHTLQRLRCEVIEMPMRWDLDTADDLDRYRRFVREN